MTRARSWAGIVGLPVVAALLVIAAAVLPAATPDETGTESIDVDRTTYACPAGSGLSVATGQLAPGDARRIRVAPEGDVDDESALDAAAWSVAKIDGRGAIVTQEGEESGAVGFWSGTAPRGDGGGLVVGHCGEIIDDAWFLGLGTADRRSSTLVLSNMSDTPAVADVLAWGPDGPIDVVGGSGVLIEPFTVRPIRVAEFAAGRPDLALQVVRRRGQLAAAAYVASSADDAGTEAIGATAPPSTEQIVPGLAGGAEGRTLMLLNPTRQTARVDVTALTDAGPISDDALQAVRVEAGSYLEVPIPESLGGGAQALQVVGDRPVAASVRLQPEPDDFAVAEGSPVLDGPAIVPVRLGSNLGDPLLVVTAPRGDATVTLTAFDERMEPIGRLEAEIADQTSGYVDSGDLDADGRVAYLVLESDDQVVAAATYATGDRVASLLVRSAPVSIDVPTVIPRD